MSKKDFQNGFALGNIISGASEIKLLEHTITFLLNDELYEIVGVKDSGSVDAPLTIPSVDNNNFKGWYDGDTAITFPYTPTEDKELVGVFGGLSDVLYEYFEVDKTQYPVLGIRCFGYDPKELLKLVICFGKTYECTESGQLSIPGERLEQLFSLHRQKVLHSTRTEVIVNFILKRIKPELQMKNEDSCQLTPVKDMYYIYTNFDNYNVDNEHHIIY